MPAGEHGRQTGVLDRSKSIPGCGDHVGAAYVEVEDVLSKHRIDFLLVGIPELLVRLQLLVLVSPFNCKLMFLCGQLVSLRLNRTPLLRKQVLKARHEFVHETFKALRFAVSKEAHHVSHLVKLLCRKVWFVLDIVSNLLRDLRYSTGGLQVSRLVNKRILLHLNLAMLACYLGLVFLKLFLSW